MHRYRSKLACLFKQVKVADSKKDLLTIKYVNFLYIPNLWCFIVQALDVYDTTENTQSLSTAWHRISVSTQKLRLIRESLLKGGGGAKNCLPHWAIYFRVAAFDHENII